MLLLKSYMLKWPQRDSLDVDRSIPLTETEFQFCDLWSETHAESNGVRTDHVKSTVFNLNIKDFFSVTVHVETDK